jgi:hypothetical protein
MTTHQRIVAYGFCLVVLITTSCAAQTRAIKRTWDMPHSPAYDKLLDKLAQGNGLSATYHLPVNQARTLALFVIGTNHAVGVTERQQTILAIIPDLRNFTPDIMSTNHIAIRLTPTPTGTTLTVLTSMGDLTGPMLSAAIFHRLFADAINRSPLTVLPTAPPAGITP